jgi:hypothetical protein
MSDFYIEGHDYDEEWQRDFREGRRLLEKYPDILGPPIYIDMRLPADLRQQQWDKQAHSKLRLLFALFGINPQKLGPAIAKEQLADALILQLPGFRTTLEPPASPRAKKARGAPKKYTDIECARIVMIVGKAMKEIAAEGRRPSILAALERELEKGDLGGLALKFDLKTKMDAKSMKPRYDELKKIWINLPANKELLKDPRNTPELLAEDYLKFIELQGLAPRPHK